MASAGKAYTAVANPSGTLSLAEWLTGDPFAASIDAAHAVLVQVNWTRAVNTTTPAGRCGS